MKIQGHIQLLNGYLKIFLIQIFVSRFVIQFYYLFTIMKYYYQITLHIIKYVQPKWCPMSWEMNINFLFPMNNYLWVYENLLLPEKNLYIENQMACTHVPPVFSKLCGTYT